MKWIPINQWYGRTYLYVCNRYYGWYVHENDGFRLAKKDWLYYQIGAWIFLTGEELNFILTRADVTTGLTRALTNAMVVGGGIYYFMMNEDIRKARKRYRVEKEKTDGIEGTS